MANHFSAVLLGRLGRDPEQRGDLARVSVAVSKRRKDKPESVTWVNVTGFGKTAELMMRLKKGEACGFQGDVAMNEYTDKNGVIKQSLELIAREVIFLGNGNAKDGSASKWPAEQPSAAGVDDDAPF